MLITPVSLILINLRPGSDDGLCIVREIHVCHRTGNTEIITPFPNAAGPGVEQLALDTQLLIEQGTDGRGTGEVFRTV